MMSNTTFKIGGLKRVLGALILGVLVLIVPFFVSAWYDDLEYDLGELVGQGDWVHYGNDSEYWIVQSDVVYSGEKAINYQSESSGVVEKEFGETISDGVFSFYGRYSGELCRDEIQLWEDEGIITAIEISCNSKKINYYSGGWITIKENISADTWYRIESEWRDSDKKWRFRVDDEDWTDWVVAGSFTTGINSVHLYGAKSYIYLDAFQVSMPCKVGFCKYCEIYDTCVEADCSWYYSIYLQKYYCVEPFTPDLEDCGPFYKCQYCLTQEPCELELNCEWVDRGFGEKCYMIEPEIPVEQVGWEVPELEDCGELSGVEKWLCEIKNFIAGIFMPSQEALDKLYNTIGNFKNRFPFNYIGALNSFFDDIKDSLDEEKEIPVKILGQEGDVDFSFWDKTTTIGGVGETFKNILFDFTTLIVFFGWLVWLISFIKRFF